MTTSNNKQIRWAPRVPQDKIRRLYETDAKGIYDEELLDDVGWALYLRCESFLTAVEAVNGRAKCPQCKNIILHNCIKEEMLHCENCGWEILWGEYFKTIQGKQLSGAKQVIELFKDYMNKFPDATSPREKTLLIDRLLHGFHWAMKLGKSVPSRAAGVNLIEGKLSEVIDFLDNLTYGEGSTPGTKENLSEWRENEAVRKAWWDAAGQPPDKR